MYRERNFERRDPVVVGTLASGETVIDRPNSHLEVDDGSLSEYLPKALQKINAEGREFIQQAVDFGQFVGVTNCVKVSESDQTFFAQRPKRKGPTRFVLNRQPEPSTELSVILKKVEDNRYIIITAYVGPLAGPEPWDQNATEESIEFWQHHALVWDDSAEVLPKQD